MNSTNYSSKEIECKISKLNWIVNCVQWIYEHIEINEENYFNMGGAYFK